MKNNKVNSIILGISLLCIASSSWAQTTFDFTGGSQTYEVPPGVTSIQIEAWGAQGQPLTNEEIDPSTGGLGGYAVGVLEVTPGQILNIFVGGAGADGVAGFNGGGLGGFGTPTTNTGGFAGSGGGASDVRLGGTALTDRIIVAGGGGGGGRDYLNGTCQPCGEGGNGGDGGGLVGSDGADPAPGTSPTGSFPNPGAGGQGGTQTAGGLGGDGLAGPPGLPGVLGQGGVGLDGTQSVASGGGGGGYYGGGSGGSADSGNGAAAGGGGGGSSYIGGVTSGSTLAGQNTGDGRVVITELAGPVAEARPIPTLGVYGLIFLSLMMALMATGRRFRA